MALGVPQVAAGAPVLLIPCDMSCLGVFPLSITATASINVITAANATEIIRLYGGILTALAGAIQLTFRDSVATAANRINSISIPAGASLALPYTGMPYMQMGAGGSLTSTASSTSGYAGVLWYRRDQT